jgi:hypothetical protein
VAGQWENVQATHVWKLVQGGLAGSRSEHDGNRHFLVKWVFIRGYAGRFETVDDMRRRMRIGPASGKGRRWVKKQARSMGSGEVLEVSECR